MPALEVLLSFSEPVLWRDTSLLGLANVVLVNMTARTGPPAYRDVNATESALWGIWLWGLGGSQATVIVHGAAYADISGNTGLQSREVKVCVVGVVGNGVSKLWIIHVTVATVPRMRNAGIVVVLSILFYVHPANRRHCRSSSRAAWLPHQACHAENLQTLPCGCPHTPQTSSFLWPLPLQVERGSTPSCSSLLHSAPYTIHNMMLLLPASPAGLQVAIPDPTRTQRMTTAGQTAAAVSIAAAAAAGASSGSLIRSLGHTQFLAMCVSLTVPYLPPEFIKLCQGLQ